MTKPFDWLPDDVDWSGVDRDLDERLLRTWHARIPARFYDATVDSLDEATRRPVREWVDAAGRGRNLVLIGPVGVGKTWAAVASCRQAHFRGLEVRFVAAYELFDLLRPREDHDPQAVMDALVHCDRLVVDDLGTERQTDWTAERLQALVDSRWSNRRSIVVTLNAPPERLSDWMDGRIASRLLSDATVVVLNGEDRRRQL